jgi:oligopeptide/dipeptide ABC transporter ATP-binding protein
MLERVGIPDAASRIDRYPARVQRRHAPARHDRDGVALQAGILIADEPTTALDVTIQAQILDLIRDMRNETGTAVILITHDLGVVAGNGRRVAVMYAGRIVEQAPVRELFANPRHPYTLGLLRSIPRLDRDSERLTPIPGRPPELRRLGAGCPFVPRCEFAIDRCRATYPDFRPSARPPAVVLGGCRRSPAACSLPDRFDTIAAIDDVIRIEHRRRDAGVIRQMRTRVPIGRSALESFRAAAKNPCSWLTRAMCRPGSGRPSMSQTRP